MKVILNSEAPREEVIFLSEYSVIDADIQVLRELEVRTKNGNQTTCIRTPTSDQAFL
jgi:hypothetical protein